MQPKQAGKNWGSLRGKIFTRLPSRELGLGWEQLRSLAPSREARQNIFQFLLEEKRSRAKSEMQTKLFFGGASVSERRRGGFHWSGIFDKIGSREVV